LFGLQWRDIDWGNGTGGRLTIRRSIVCGRLETPKTEESKRTIDIADATLTELMIYREMYPPISDGFLFRSSTGAPLNPDNWYKRKFRAIVKAAGLRPIGLHTLRHTYCSLLVNQGEGLKYVSRQLGHSSTNLTANLYAHLFSKTRRTAMRRLDGQIPRRDRAVSSNGHLMESADLTKNSTEREGMASTLTTEKD
jgi:integrase